MRFLLFMPLAAAAAWAQNFGGAPPWGPEKPVRFVGEIHWSQERVHTIGGGLVFAIARDGEDWGIEVRSEGGGDDYSRCATPPFHGPNPRDVLPWHFRDGAQGPGGAGVKRQIDFVLTVEDHRAECAEMERALQGGDSSWGTRISGRCWFRPTAVKLSDDPPESQLIETMAYEAECGLYGALEVWRLPARYVIPDGFTGWVTIAARQEGKPELERDGDRYVVRIPASGLVETVSDLRPDGRGAEFVDAHGRTVPVQGWEVGVPGSCLYQSFFVGSKEAYAARPANPALKNARSDCAETVPSVK